MKGIQAAMAAGVMCIVGSVVNAQALQNSLIGTWAAPSGYCGTATVIVTSVEQNGVVHGTFICERTGWKPIMGDKIGRNAVKGTLAGTRFVMENAEGGGFDLVVEGVTAKGYGRVRASSASNPITYTKQR